jgi:tetratricopeptide (TPR) repeat protein
VIAWALSKDAFTDDGVSTAVRESVATEFGLLLAAMCLLLLAAGLAIGFGAARRPPSALLRRRAGIAVAAVACLVPLVALGSVALSDKGIGGTVSDLTSEKASIGGGPSRLTQASSSRGRYWRQAAEVFKDHPVRGTGAGSFRVSRLRHRNDALVAGHAHGYVAQTAADLGLLGLLASVALAAAWLATASRNLGVRRGGHRLPFDAERAGAVALALAALVFGLQSAIDWVWFVPGPTVMALVAAGFVAGRGPIPVLRDRERAPEAAATEAAPAAPAPGRPPRPSTERLVGAGAVVVVALACAWSAWQPERSDGAGDRALALLDEGKLDPAAREADRAHDMNPLSPKPRYVKAAILDRAGRPDEALAVLQQAVIEHPSEPDVWLRLADFQLHVLANPAAAVETLRGALYLDPHSRAAQAAFFEARERSRERTAAAPF